MRKLLSLGRAVTFINQSKATRLFAASLFIGVGMFALRTSHASAAAGACSSATDYGSVSFNATNAASNPAADAVNIPAGPLTVWTRMAVPDTTNTTYMLEIDSGTPSVQCLTIGGGTSIPTTPKLTQNPVPDTPATNWTWVNYQNGVTGTPVTVNFATTAKHNIRLVGNKANVAVDRVLFTACTPTGTGDNCTVTANVPPTVSVTAPANSATFTAPATISITANAADSDGTVSKVDFYQGSTLIGTDTTSPYSFSWTNVAAGTYSITAKATDNAGAPTTSSAVNVTVISGGGTDTTPPVVTLGIANGTIISTDLISTVHANLTSSAYAVSATASDASGIASVVFKVDGVVKATVTTAPFNMTFDARTLTCTAAVNGLGTGHTITATATDRATTPNSATATVTVGATRGADINGDCLVQNLDFSALIAKFGQSGTNLGRADINADDTVQNLDFSALIAKFGQ